MADPPPQSGPHRNRRRRSGTGRGTGRPSGGSSSDRSGAPGGSGAAGARGDRTRQTGGTGSKGARGRGGHSSPGGGGRRPAPRRTTAPASGSGAAPAARAPSGRNTPSAPGKPSVLHRHVHVPGVAVEDAEIRANRRRAVVLAVGASLVPAVLAAVVVGAVLGLIEAVVALAAMAAVVAVAIWRRSTAVAIGRLGARPLRGDESPRLVNLVESLCGTFGLRPPRLMVVEDPLPNACSLGRTPGDAVLVVTSGLLDRLDLMQMEGVVAHELAHVRRHDTVVSGVAVTVLAPVARFTGDDRWLHRALGRGREYRADQVAAAAVRYPTGLCGALEVMAAAPPPVPGSVFDERRLAATRWLWIDPLADRRSSPGDPGGIDEVRVRAAALAEW